MLAFSLFCFGRIFEAFFIAYGRKFWQGQAFERKEQMQPYFLAWARAEPQLTSACPEMSGEFGQKKSS
ncbi:MAG: hypothetical protein J5846_07250 [Desulfovibrio sp.]|nr:hypothetical protein [Desulfovibrio sp.]